MLISISFSMTPFVTTGHLDREAVASHLELVNSRNLRQITDKAPVSWQSPLGSFTTAWPSTPKRLLLERAKSGNNGSEFKCNL
jgi:hypothetical protein